MKKAVLLSWFLLWLKSSIGQTNIDVVFIYNNRPLSSLPWLLPGGMEITNLKFYISSVTLWKDGAPLWKEGNSYHLIDVNDTSSLDLSLTAPGAKDFDTLEFQLGVDSAKSE